MGAHTASIWNLEDGTEMSRVSDPHPVLQARFSPDELDCLLTYEGLVRIIDIDSRNARLPDFQHSERKIYSYVNYTRNGTKIFTMTELAVRLFDAKTGTKLWKKRRGDLDGEPRWAGLPRNDEQLLVHDHTGAVSTIELATGEISSVFHADRGSSVGISPNQRLLAVGTSNGEVRVWDRARQVAITPPLKHSGAVTRVVFSRANKSDPDGGSYLLSCSVDGTARVWSTDLGEPVTPILRHNGPIRDGDFSSDGRFVVTASDDGAAKVWRIHEPDSRSAEELELNSIMHAGHRLDAGVYKPVGPVEAKSIREELVDFSDREHEPRKKELQLAQFQDKKEHLKEYLDRVVRLTRVAVQDHETELAKKRLSDVLLGYERQLDMWTPSEQEMQKIRSLIEDLNQPSWHPVSIRSVTSRAGATLTEQDDGSVLASGTNEPGDTYTIQAVCELDHIAGIRLELLPDSSLPNKGPGRHESGNFQLESIHLYKSLEPGDGRGDDLPFMDVNVSFNYPAPNVHELGTIRPDDPRVWHISGKYGQEHYAEFTLAKKTPLESGKQISIELKSHRIESHSDVPVNIGRFRLQVTSDDRALFVSRILRATTGMPPSDVLAAAWLCQMKSDK